MFNRYYWKGVRNDVQQHVYSCELCQRVNGPKIKTASHMHSIDIQPQSMSKVGVDITTLPKSDEGYIYLIVAVDYFTKWPEARPLKNKTAEDVARFLFEDIVCRHGCVDIQINDQGREFCNKITDILTSLTGTKQKVTSAYHPQANGLVERQNRTIKDCLVKILLAKKEWPNCVPGTLFAIRTSQHSSTGYSPFQMMYNRQAKLPIECHLQDVDSPSEADNVLPKTNENNIGSDSNDDSNGLLIPDIVMRATVMENIRNNIFKNAKQKIEKAQAHQRRNYDERNNIKTFQIGQTVKILNLRRMDRKGGKFSYRWSGPFKVKAIKNKNNYVVLSKNGSKQCEKVVNEKI